MGPETWKQSPSCRCPTSSSSPHALFQGQPPEQPRRGTPAPKGVDWEPGFKTRVSHSCPGRANPGWPWLGQFAVSETHETLAGQLQRD
jgi:hypothetical protein